jgi:hypothetical protein
VLLLLLSSLAVQAQAAPSADAPDRSSASATPTPRLVPNDGRHVTWRRSGLADYATTALLLGTYFLVDRGIDNPTKPAWTKPVPLIDRPVRDALASRTRAGRDSAYTQSDYLWHGMEVAPFVNALVPPLVRGADASYIWELEWINAEAFVLTSVVERLPHKLLPRSRPAETGCEKDPDFARHCRGSARYASFWAGHVSTSFTGAGLICAHNVHANVYGHTAANAAVCGLALSAATAVGYLRIRADEHWLSDDLVGAAVGLGVGYAMPTFVFYHPFWRLRPRGAPTVASGLTVTWTARPMLLPGGFGASAGGTF